MLQELATQEGLVQQAVAWAEAICAALVDPAHAAAAAGFDAIRSASPPELPPSLDMIYRPWLPAARPAAELRDASRAWLAMTCHRLAEGLAFHVICDHRSHLMCSMHIEVSDPSDRVSLMLIMDGVPRMPVMLKGAVCVRAV